MKNLLLRLVRETDGFQLIFITPWQEEDCRPSSSSTLTW